MAQHVDLRRKYPPSAACDCEICRGYCVRPGWWTVQEGSRACSAGYGQRMMLELAPGHVFGVLSPAFKGCENTFAWQEMQDRGCTFFFKGGCELHGTGFQPLECRFCHHERAGLGDQCHADIGKEWNGQPGRFLVGRWCRRNGLWQYLELYGLGKLKHRS